MSIKRLWHPHPISFDQRVCHFDELTHDLNDGDLCLVSDCAEGVIFKAVPAHLESVWDSRGRNFLIP